MKTPLIVLLTLVAVAAPLAAQSASPTPATTGAAVRDASDDHAREAYRSNPKSAEALYDYTFSLIKLQQYVEARRVLGEWKAVAPQDGRHAEVGTLIDRLEKASPAERDRVAADWAREQRQAAEKEIRSIRDGMAKVGEGLARTASQSASRTATDVPRLQELVAREPTAANWLALCEAQVAASDFEAALRSAEKALARDPGDVVAASTVTHLKNYDGKNGEDIRQALRKERLNRLLKELDR